MKAFGDATEYLDTSMYVLDQYPKGHGFDSHRGQADFSACPVWMHTQSNITNIMYNIIRSLSFYCT